MTTSLENVDADSLYALMLEQDDNYNDDARIFVSFLKENGFGISYEGLKAYAAYLDSEIKGRRYSANTYNKRILGAKKRLKYLFLKSSESFDTIKRFQFEEALKEIRLKKINSSAVNKDKILTTLEIDRLVNESEDTTISLMIEFLYNTGLRVSEMKFILLSDIKNEGNKFIIKINGKGDKERKIFIQKDLIYRIKNHFAGIIYLFEHDGKTYSRSSISDRIKLQGKIILNKNISAHTLRHSFATNMLEKTSNLKGVSKYLGHSSTSITADLYIHEELSWYDVRAT